MSRMDEVLKCYYEQKAETDEKIASGIEKYRKGNAHLIFTSENGEFPKNITVEVEQLSHEFRFGANLFMLDELETREKNIIYREKFAKLFNIATIPFYWSTLEPEQGKPRYTKDSPRVYRRPAPDLCVEYCQEKGIEPKCHCLNYDQFTPDWMAEKTVAEEKKLLEKRFSELAERYAAVIPTWEVTNETLEPGLGKTNFFYEDDFAEWSFRMADKYFPNNRLIINDYNIWFPGSYNNRHAYFMQIERLVRNGLRVDSIGMQFHSFFPFAQEAEIAQQRYNPAKLYKMMDLYGKLGIPEQITEMTIPAYGDDEENEAVQAELVKLVYSIFFSHPAMEGIFYWNLVDGYAHKAEPGEMTAGENIYYGGLLRFDMTEKPAFQVIDDLIHKQWHTSETLKVTDGKADFRGFYGDYKLTVHADGKIVPVNFKLTKNREPITIKL